MKKDKAKILTRIYEQAKAMLPHPNDLPCVKLLQREDFSSFKKEHSPLIDPLGYLEFTCLFVGVCCFVSALRTLHKQKDLRKNYFRLLFNNIELRELEKTIENDDFTSLDTAIVYLFFQFIFTFTEIPLQALVFFPSEYRTCNPDESEIIDAIRVRGKHSIIKSINTLDKKMTSFQKIDMLSAIVCLEDVPLKEVQ